MWFAIGRAANFHANYMMGVRQKFGVAGKTPNAMSTHSRP
jgi:hypothetical protein